MKKILFLLVLAIPLGNVYAQTIQTGDAKAEVRVETNVSGGDTYTKIEVEANGEKKILETTEPGVHSLEINSSGETTVNQDKVSPSATVTPKITQEKKTTVNPLSSIFESFKNWIANLFKTFHF